MFFNCLQIFTIAKIVTFETVNLKPFVAADRKDKSPVVSAYRRIVIELFVFMILIHIKGN